MAEVLQFIYENIPKTVRYNPESEGTRIGLPYKYNVPCVGGSFQEMYYWDTYFLNRGLIIKGDIEQAKALKDNLYRIETDYGILTTEKAYGEGKYLFQWQNPNGWAPLHNIVCRAMLYSGFTEDAKRIAQKYINLVDSNFETTGNLWEKYNVVTGKTDVKAEKTNSGKDMPAMMGWTAGAYIESVKIVKEN